MTPKPANPVSCKRRAFGFITALAARLARNISRCPEHPRSIFVLRNNGIGDLLAITPMFEDLRRTFPQARLVVGVADWNLEVLAGNPCVDEVLPINAPWHNPRDGAGRVSRALSYLTRSPELAALAQRNCEVGIDVLGSGFGSLLLMRAGIPWRLGMRGYADDALGVQQRLDYRSDDHVGRGAQRFVELLGGCPAAELRPQIFRPAKPPLHGAVVIAPGAAYATKCWPLGHFAGLLDRLVAHRVILIGGVRERALCEQLSAGRSHVENLAGTLSLPESFAQIGGASLVISNSSMAMHVAAAFRRPCVVVLGTDFADAAQHAAQWAYPETEVLGASDGHPGIWTPAEVWPVISRLLALS